ncbi:MarR family transcriptional regulator [Acholeplasma equirhinis]|uniref:MarR family winged helix-turn-helix transcriptional regulator n=1 Tax=Acholeplasma equirhinis TaxID=555393 RepID=UPI00197ABF78|nr:MarR family transcriptional regulator [Acholeplasma equirhinis]MBN3490309.1 MarR family transcriptional regulator [Acholeplasma equirhinis]
MNYKEELKSMTILFKAFQSVEAFAKKDIAKYGMNPTEFAALEALYHKGRLPVQGMCQKVLIANSSMTYVLDKLQEKKLIERIQDSTDKRTFYVELTGSGKKLADDIFPKHYEVMRQVFEVLTAEEKKMLGELLKKVGFNALDMADSIE